MTTIAQYLKNAGSYSSTVVNAAQTVVNRYQGTTMGIAAALRFIAILGASLSVADFIFLIAVVGGTAGTLFLAYEWLFGG